MMDILAPERALGATALALLAATGLASLVGRATSSRRIATIMAVTFGLAFAYQAVLLGVLAVTTGLDVPALSVGVLAGSAVIDAGIAGVAVIVLRALELRFGDIERGEW